MDTVYAAMVIIRKYRIKDPIEMVWHPDEQMRLFLSPTVVRVLCHGVGNSMIFTRLTVTR